MFMWPVLPNADHQKLLQELAGVCKLCLGYRAHPRSPDPSGPWFSSGESRVGY